MQQGYVKQGIGLLFLTIFLMVKMAGLHVLVHDEDQDQYAHCIVGDHIIKTQQAPEITPSATAYDLLVEEPRPKKQISQAYTFITVGILASSQLFCRPPPLTT